MYCSNKMLVYMLYLVLHQTVCSQMLSETSTSRIFKRLDRLDENVFNIRNDVIEGLRDDLRNLRKDLKEERDFRIEDISTLSNRLTGASGQVVRHDEEQVPKTQLGSCDCGAIVSQFENLMMAFKREKSENILLRKEFHEMRKHHDLEIGTVNKKFNNMDSIFNNAEKTLRSEIDTIINEKIAQFHEMTKQQDFKIGNVIEKCHKVESRLNSAQETLRSDIDTIQKETVAVNQRYAVCQKDINNTRSYFNDGLIHLNESLTNSSLNTLHAISLITSDTDNLKKSNKVLKSKTDTLIRHLRFPQSCDSVVESGEYAIFPDAYIDGMNVYCYVDSSSKAWTVIQRRKDGSVDFKRTWAEYKAGFGDLSGEFWLGNEHIYQLTKDTPRKLRIDMETFDGRKAHALYSGFNISSESEKYKLYLAGYTGDAGDVGFDSAHSGLSFSTLDRDNDLSISHCCACEYGGGWWYYYCYNVNLNDKYSNDEKGIEWFKFANSTSLKFVQMSMR